MTPGPNMGWLALLCALEGRRAGLVAVLGVAVGLLGLGLAMLFGMARLTTEMPMLLGPLRWAGCATMLWIAWDTWPRRAASRAAQEHTARHLVRTFSHGLVLNLLNPKSALFFALVLPEFFHPGLAPLQQALTLTLVYVAVASAVHLAIVLMADRVHGWLSDPARATRIRQGFALLLVGLAIWIALRG
nr:LysE family translocator [Sphingobium subterraneum]